MVIKTNSKPTGGCDHIDHVMYTQYNYTDPHPSEHYYMLTEDLPEDKKLRQEIHLKKLVSKSNGITTAGDRTFTVSCQLGCVTEQKLMF